MQKFPAQSNRIIKRYLKRDVDKKSRAVSQQKTWLECLDIRLTQSRKARKDPKKCQQEEEEKELALVLKIHLAMRDLEEKNKQHDRRQELLKGYCADQKDVSQYLQASGNRN